MFKVPQNLFRSIGASSTLYFVESGEFVKVGLADDIAKRMNTLQLGNPLPLRLAAWRTIPRALNLQIERLVHVRLEPWAMGREWFRMTGKAAARLADPVVKKAHATVRDWSGRGIDTGTGRGLANWEVQELLAGQGVAE